MQGPRLQNKRGRLTGSHGGRNRKCRERRHSCESGIASPRKRKAVRGRGVGGASEAVLTVWLWLVEGGGVWGCGPASC